MDVGEPSSVFLTDIPSIVPCRGHVWWDKETSSSFRDSLDMVLTVHCERVVVAGSTLLACKRFQPFGPIVRETAYQILPDTGTTTKRAKSQNNAITATDAAIQTSPNTSILALSNR